MTDQLELREVEKEDMKAAYDLSNEEYVRKYSLHKNKIKWEEHITWFDAMLNNDDVVYYVVSDSEKRYLGQVRYQISEKEALVSISLSKEIRGKGYAGKLLAKGNHRIFSERKQVDHIIAYVSFENLASKKIFDKLEFKIESIDEDGFYRMVLDK